MSAFDALQDWLAVYIKNRDLYTKSLRSLKPTDDFDFVAHHEETVRYYLVRPLLTDVGEVVKKSKERKLFVVMANQKRNVDTIIKHWDVLKSCDELCLLFVNPTSGEKWMLYPKTHDLITDAKALKPGLYSLFEGVEPYGYE